MQLFVHHTVDCHGFFLELCRLHVLWENVFNGIVKVYCAKKENLTNTGYAIYGKPKVVFLDVKVNLEA